MLRQVGVRKLRDNQHLLSAVVADLCAKKKAPEAWPRRFCFAYNV